MVELSEDDLPRLDEVKRKVLDGFHVRIRELKRADLVGKAGIEALRAEFIDVVNAAMAPARANDVLFTEMLVK